MDEKSVKNSSAIMKECFNIPKIDIHAHLNGSIRRITFYELLSEEYRREVSELFKEMNYKNAFKLFSYLGIILTDLSIVKRITHEMIEDWNKHNVIYLEIRTSLKRINNTSKIDYLNTILEEINESNQKLDIQTRLIISINRDLPISEAEDTFNSFLAFESPLKKLIVGVDYCGNEDREQFKWSDIVPILNKFKECGLKVTYHIAESKNYQMIDFEVFKPDRLGHTYFFSDEHVNQTIQQRIPVEFCPSSAMCTLGVDSFKNIPWTKYVNKSKNLNHFICINTDDTLLFNGDITQECFEICNAFNISITDLKTMYLSTIDFIFETDILFRENLKKKILEFN